MQFAFTAFYYVLASVPLQLVCVCCWFDPFKFIAHQLKRVYALNLNISVSAAQKKKLTRIPSVTASEVGNKCMHRALVFVCIKARRYNLILFCSASASQKERNCSIEKTVALFNLFSYKNAFYCNLQHTHIYITRKLFVYFILN